MSERKFGLFGRGKDGGHKVPRKTNIGLSDFVYSLEEGQVRRPMHLILSSDKSFGSANRDLVSTVNLEQIDKQQQDWLDPRGLMDLLSELTSASLWKNIITKRPFKTQLKVMWSLGSMSTNEAL